MRAETMGLILILAMVLYLNFCLFIYAQANPHLTQTQVWDHAWEAVTWSWLR